MFQNIFENEILPLQKFPTAVLLEEHSPVKSAWEHVIMTRNVCVGTEVTDLYLLPHWDGRDRTLTNWIIWRSGCQWRGFYKKWFTRLHAVA
jgi:hypothetical protein